MVNVKRAAQIIAELGMLKYFPSSDFAQAGIVRLVCQMATTEDQIRGLVDRMLNLYNDWPGPQEMRACFCSKFKPADGIEASSAVFFESDGIPSEKESAPQQLEAQPVHRLTAAELTKDERMRSEIANIAARKRLQ